jgi:hypothetical protein
MTTANTQVYPERSLSNSLYEAYYTLGSACPEHRTPPIQLHSYSFCDMGESPHPVVLFK